MACAIAVTSLSLMPLASTSSGAVDDRRGLTAPVRSVAAPEKCLSAHRAVRFYSRRIAEHRAKMRTLRVPESAAIPAPVKGRCPRYLAHVLQRKARAWRLRVERYVHYHYAWADWLPAKWQRIGACETGYGRRPGNWRHSNSAYEGAFGFAKSSWDAFKERADRKAGPYPDDAWQATPRQQWEVALAIYRMYGLSGWGCRNA